MIKQFNFVKGRSKTIKNLRPRRQRLLDEIKSKGFAACGIKKESALQDTDDALPYKPILLDINKVLAHLRTKRAHRTPAKAGQQVPTGSPAAKVASATSQLIPSKSIRPTTSCIASAPSSTAAETSKLDTGSAASKAASSGGVQSSVVTEEMPSSTSMTSSSDVRAKSNMVWLAFYLAMIEDVEKSVIEPKKKEAEAKLTGAQLEGLLRNQPEKFDDILLEHPKQFLLFMLPTPQESLKWEQEGSARPNMNSKFPETTFQLKPVSSKTFFC